MNNTTTQDGNFKSVKTKLRMSFITLLAFMIICVILSIIAIFKISSDYQYAINTYGFAQGYAGQLGTEFNTMTSNLRDLILETEESQILDIKAKIEENIANDQIYLQKIKDAASTAEEDALISEIETALNAYSEIRTKVIALASSNQNDEAYDLLTSDGIPYSNTIKKNINSILNLNIQKCNDTMSTANSLTFVLTLAIAVFTLAAVIVGIKLSGSISNSISVPLAEITASADSLKNGRLDIDIRHTSQDELGVLSEAFRETCSFLNTVVQDVNFIMSELSIGNLNVKSRHPDSYIGEFQTLYESIQKMIVQVNDTMEQINNASSQVAMGSTQMSENSTDLAEGATEQAGAVQELQATIADISSQVSENARQAMDASERANIAAKEADISNQEMASMTEAMQRITETSQKIENIIAGIEEIASQTNLLSLNAAIEAARAGEAGKGFAVVADQVKVLAAQSAESAKDTRLLIESSIQEVNRGSEITIKTAESLDKVVSEIQVIKDSIDKVSISSQRQEESMHQLEQGVDQISGVVQSNSASAEECSATSEELSAQAEGLSQLVDRFTLRK